MPKPRLAIPNWSKSARLWLISHGFGDQQTRVTGNQWEREGARACWRSVRQSLTRGPIADLLLLISGLDSRVLPLHTETSVEAGAARQRQMPCRERALGLPTQQVTPTKNLICQSNKNGCNHSPSSQSGKQQSPGIQMVGLTLSPPPPFKNPLPSSPPPTHTHTHTPQPHPTSTRIHVRLGRHRFKLTSFSFFFFFFFSFSFFLPFFFHREESDGILSYAEKACDHFTYGFTYFPCHGC